MNDGDSGWIDCSGSEDDGRDVLSSTVVHVSNRSKAAKTQLKKSFNKSRVGIKVSASNEPSPAFAGGFSPIAESVSKVAVAGNAQKGADAAKHSDKAAKKTHVRARLKAKQHSKPPRTKADVQFRDAHVAQLVKKVKTIDRKIVKTKPLHGVCTRKRIISFIAVAEAESRFMRDTETTRKLIYELCDKTFNTVRSPSPFGIDEDALSFDNKIENVAASSTVTIVLELQCSPNNRSVDVLMINNAEKKCDLLVSGSVTCTCAY